MGGFLAALGSGVAGAGGAAAQYGQQIRSLLESRRQDFASLMMHSADQAVDPAERAQYLSTASDLLSNKPMEKILPPFVKKVQEVHQGNQALAQAIGGPPAQPAPSPGPQPGATPGTGSVAAPSPAASAPAAQPATNPLQGGPIGIPAPVAPSAPAIPSPMDVLGQFTQRPEYQTPAGRAMLAPAMAAELQHNEGLRQQAALRQMNLGERQGALSELQKSPEWDNLPDILKAQFRLWAHTVDAPVPSMSAGLMRPVSIGQDQPSGAIPPADLRDLAGNPIDSAKVPYVRQQLNLLTGQSYYVPATGPMARATDAAGNVSSVANLPGANLGLDPGLVTANQRPREEATAGGGRELVTPGQAPIPLPGAVTPSMLGTEHTASDVTNAAGVHTATSVTRKVLPPGAPASGGATPVPAAPGHPVVPASGALPNSYAVKPLDPTNELDHKVIAMATDAAAAAHLLTNAQDKDRVNRRMAELGLQPGMITGSMRDRAKNARLILGHLDEINGIINKAEKDGDLGVVSTRWNDFLTNKLGEDPTKTQVFAKLSSELGFLSTAVSMAHGGLRGGSSPTMVEHWEKALDAKDPATLRAKLGEAKKWMEGYSKLDSDLPESAGGGIPAPGAAAAPKRKTWNPSSGNFE